ncbi:hypothetical protein BD779DRAFT_1802210 [Infundibulicybe gibba]|nr:hypothetical protein BD779DRAFT_1802210 [Infundibulicybe gibba]
MMLRKKRRSKKTSNRSSNESQRSSKAGGIGLHDSWGRSKRLPVGQPPTTGIIMEYSANIPLQEADNGNFISRNYRYLVEIVQVLTKAPIKHPATGDTEPQTTKKVTKKGAWVLASIRLRGLLDTGETYAFMFVQSLGLIPEDISSDTGPVPWKWRKWVASLPTGELERIEHVVRMLEAELRARESDPGDESVELLKILLQEPRRALGMLLQGSRSKLRRDGNIAAHESGLPKESYREEIRNYCEYSDMNEEELEGVLYFTIVAAAWKEHRISKPQSPPVSTDIRTPPTEP